MHHEALACAAATWPQATCHTVTAVVGAGVLGLPFAFSYLGWVAGTLFLAFAAGTSYYTSFQLAGMHEHEGKRLNRYQDVGMSVLGPVWGRWAVVPFQYIVMVSPPLE
jgi:amino acid permease